MMSSINIKSTQQIITKDFSTFTLLPTNKTILHSQSLISLVCPRHRFKLHSNKIHFSLLFLYHTGSNRIPTINLFQQNKISIFSINFKIKSLHLTKIPYFIEKSIMVTYLLQQPLSLNLMFPQIHM